MRLTKKQREQLFLKYDGKCAYCGCDLQKGWHADHIEAVERWNGKMYRPENDVIENMNPSCPSCNIFKHSSCLETFRWQIENCIKLLNNTTQYKFAKKFGLVEETQKKVKFYFEEYKEVDNGKENR